MYKERRLEQLKSQYKDPSVVIKNQGFRKNSSPDWGSQDEVRVVEEQKTNMKEYLGEVMINRFAALGGFSLLAKLISGENGIGNNGNSNAKNFFKSGTLEIEDEPAISSLKVTEMILSFFVKICPKFQDYFKDKLFIEVRDRLFYRMESVSDSEIKAIDIELPKNLFKKLEDLSLELNNDQLRHQSDKERETSELELFLKFLDSTRLEKKLKGLQEIKRYITRIEVSLTQNSWADEKELRYFDHRSFINWILEKDVLGLIYKKYQHVELIKRSIEIQKFIAKNSETLPESLIKLICESCQNNHGEVLKAIYENILDLTSDLNAVGAYELYSNLDKGNLENYDEDFIDLICKYTEKCLNLFVTKHSSGVLKIKEELEKYKSNLLGIPRMFEIIRDECPVDAGISQRVLLHLLNLVNEYFILSVYSHYSKRSFQGIKEKTSVYQSLAFLNEFLAQMMSFPALETGCHQYFEGKFTGEGSMINSLISAYETYYKNVRQRIKTMKAMNNFEIDEAKWMGEIFFGKFSHELNVTQTLTSLKSFIAHPFPSQPLTFKQLKSLWVVFVVKANFDFETKSFLELISQTYEVKGKGFIPLFCMEDLNQIFVEIICQETYFNPKKFSIEKFKCLRFFFLLMNLKENNIVSETNDDDLFREENMNSFLVLDTQLSGLDTLWEYLVECNDENIVNELIKLLVNLHTKFGPTRKGEEESLYENTLQKVMISIEFFRKKKHLSAIERNIQFLERFLETIDRKLNISAFEPYCNGNMESFSGSKIQVNVKYYPYEDLKQIEIHIREKLGYIKELIARHFNISFHDFDIMIDNEVIIDSKLEDQLSDYLNLQNIQMFKRNDDSEFSSLSHRLTRKREYIDTFFSLFSSFEPGTIFE